MPFKRNHTLPSGDYDAIHVTIEERESRDGSTFKIWTFETADAVELSATSSLNSGPSSKAFKWAQAILGRTPTADEFDDDLAVLAGMPCRLVVVVDEDGYNRIDSVLPAAKPQVGSAAAMQERLATTQRNVQASFDNLSEAGL